MVYKQKSKLESSSFQINLTSVNMKLAISLLLLSVVLYVQAADLEREWRDFKVKFNRRYASPQEEAYRKGIFAQTLREVEEHNRKYKAGQVTYEKGINQFSDKTTQEFSQQNLGLRVPQNLGNLRGPSGNYRN